MTWDEIEELACLMLGKDYDTIVDNYGESIIDDMFYREYGITLEDFEHLLKDLVKFTNPWKSPITEEIYQGFVISENNNGLMRAIIKENIMTRGELLEFLTNEARTFRKDRTAVCRNGHLTGIYEIPDQELVDGILVAFINHIAMDQCIDYALSVVDL